MAGNSGHSVAAIAKAKVKPKNRRFFVSNDVVAGAV